MKLSDPAREAIVGFFFHPLSLMRPLTHCGGRLGGPRVPPPPRGGQEQGQTSIGRKKRHGEEEEVDRRTDVWIDGGDQKARKRKEKKEVASF